MNLYNIKSVFDNFQNHPYFKDKIPTKELSSTICEKFLVEELGIKRFYASTKEVNRYYSTEDDILLLTKYLEVSYPYKFNLFQKVKPTFLDDSFVIIDFDNNEDFKKKKHDFIMSPEIQKLVKKKVEDKENNKLINQDFCKNIDNINLDLSNKKIVSIDFEFVQSQITKAMKHYELGIAVYENDKVSNQHYFIKDKISSLSDSQKKEIKEFNFGESFYIDSSSIKAIIEDVIDDADYILFHAYGMNTSILNQYGINLAEKKISIIDTQLMANNFRIKSNSTLQKTLDFFKIKYENIRNAGNDAHYNLMLLLKMQK